MKKSRLIISVVTLCALLFSASYAWYKNNLQTSASSTGSVQIKGNGILRTAFTTDSNGVDVAVGSAAYKSGLTLALSKTFENVSGDGLNIYAAELSQSGVPMDGKWVAATEDSAAKEGDAGQYCVIDLYFQSDEEMDIYLMDSATISPKTLAGGADLAMGDNSSFTQFSQYSSGLPALNINQSSYGLFSRNLIAGATRAAFSEYTYSSGTWTLPDSPNVIWLPNSTYELKSYADANYIFTMNMEGTPETVYQYYTAKGVQKVERQEDGTLGGSMYIKKPGSSGWESVEVTTLMEDQLVAARPIQNIQDPIPQICVGSGFVDAAYNDTLEKFVRAEYDVTFNLTGGFAFVSTFGGKTVYVQLRDEGGYKGVTLDGSDHWVANGTVYTAEADIKTLESNMTADEAEYRITYWMEDSDTTETDDHFTIRKYKVGTTSNMIGSNYFTRIRIAVWVEGYDREANIALNGGEFNINLQFYGKAAEK